MDGHLVRVGFRRDNGVQGTVLIVSTPSHSLRDYGVYTTDGFWLGGVVRWFYQGTVAEVYRAAPAMPSSAHVNLLLGSCDEIYAFANYDGRVNMYVRATQQQPLNRYRLYELQDIARPIHFWRSGARRFVGSYDMEGW